MLVVCGCLGPGDATKRFAGGSWPSMLTGRCDVADGAIGFRHKPTVHNAGRKLVAAPVMGCGFVHGGSGCSRLHQIR